MTEKSNCPLCNERAYHYHSQKQRDFLQCGNCLSVFLHPKDYISQEKEREHYLKHNNDPEDIRYQNFVSPITNRILQDFATHHKGLDFGSGTGSPIFKLLNDNSYNIVQYDLFFHDNRELLQNKYNYIACSETAEHFKEPYREFEQLHNLLKPSGKLYVMTARFEESLDFGAWHYKTDPTHVFLYHEKAFEWIKEEFRFKNLVIDGRVAVFGV